MEPEKERPLGPGTYHLCVDMQRMFAEPTEWHLPWMDGVRPIIREIAGYQPERTVFTRFLPAENPAAEVGQWRDYYRRWQSMTLERIAPELLALVPELQALAPPAMVSITGATHRGSTADFIVFCVSDTRTPLSSRAAKPTCV